MPSNDEIITSVEQREGGAKVTDDPLDLGGKTQWGISEKSNPEAWKDGRVTESEARAIYMQKYLVGPGFDKVNDPTLRAQLVDFGVNSGPMVAIQKLQAILDVKIDGILGPKSIQAINAGDARKMGNYLVVARVRMICNLTAKNPSQVKFLVGLVDRAFQFLS